MLEMQFSIAALHTSVGVLADGAVDLQAETIHANLEIALGTRPHA